MKTIFFIFTFLFSYLGIGQENDSLLSKKGFEFYALKMYDSSAFYFNKVENKNSIDFLMLGKSYYNLDEYSNAKTYLLLAYNNTLSKKNNFLSQQTTELLGNIYFQEKNYTEALRFYKTTSEVYSSFLPCSKTINEIINLKHKISECYFQIENIDSAINTLTPYMFIDTSKYNTLDKNKYFETQKFYLALLQKKYSTKKLKDLLTESINNIVYKKELDTIFLPENHTIENDTLYEIVDIDTITNNTTFKTVIEGNETGNLGCFYNVYAYTIFLNTKIEFGGGYFSPSLETNQNTQNQYKLESFKQQLIKSYVYQQIIFK